MRGGVAVLVLLTLTSVPAVADVGTSFDAHISRLVASPTPAGPALALSDRWTWAIDLDEAAYVQVIAESDPSSAFYLTASCVPGLVALPASRQGLSCSSPGVHTIEVDPAGGAAVEIHIRFRGHVGDRDGAPHAFSLTRTSADRGCVVPGVCLP